MPQAGLSKISSHYWNLSLLQLQIPVVLLWIRQYHFHLHYKIFQLSALEIRFYLLRTMVSLGTSKGVRHSQGLIMIIRTIVSYKISLKVNESSFTYLDTWKTNIRCIRFYCCYFTSCPEHCSLQIWGWDFWVSLGVIWQQFHCFYWNSHEESGVIHIGLFPGIVTI